MAPESPSSITILDVIPNVSESNVSPISPPSSRNASHESLATPNKQQELPETPLRRIRRVSGTSPATGSVDNRRRIISGGPDVLGEKSLMSLETLSDFDGSEASHTERRFLRLYEELESHCLGTKTIKHYR